MRYRRERANSRIDIQGLKIGGVEIDDELRDLLLRVRHEGYKEGYEEGYGDRCSEVDDTKEGGING